MTRTRNEDAASRQPHGPRRQQERGQTVGELKSEYDPAEEIKHLRDVVKQKDRERLSYEKEVGKLRVLFDEMADAIDALPPPAVEYHRPRATKVETPVTHVCHLTDWHDGAQQESLEIEGLNEFSPVILREYVRNYVKDNLDWLELHRKSYTVNDVHLLLTGDYISGGIHEELRWTNAYPEPVQAIKAGELIAEVVAMLSPHYERVIVDAITVDNHARLTRKPQSQEAGINTWNYPVLRFAKERLREHKNVDFRIHEMIFKLVECGGRRYLLTHGDRVRGWAGFPYYGLERLASREAQKRMKQALLESRKVEADVAKVTGWLFDRVILGHFHAPLKHGKYWIGGSACGTTAYDHGEGREADPLQCSWMVHPGHGEFDMTDWRLRRD